MHCSAACTWAAPSLPRASAPRSTRSPNWHPTYWYPDTAPAGEHNTPSPPRYPTAGSKAVAAPATSSPQLSDPTEGHQPGAISMLGNDHVRLARPRRFFLVEVFAVQKDNDVTILLNAIVQADSICHKI